MARLILVRHAHPAVEPGVPSRSWRLSDEGREAARVLAERLKQLAPDVIVSSLEPKAQETAEIVAGRLGMPCSTAPGLHEHDREGAPFLGAEEFQRTIAELFARPNELVYGRETAAQARNRFGAAVEALLAERPRRTLAIVAHGTVIALYVAARTGADGHASWRSLAMADFVALDIP